MTIENFELIYSGPYVSAVVLPEHPETLHPIAAFQIDKQTLRLERASVGPLFLSLPDPAPSFQDLIHIFVLDQNGITVRHGQAQREVS
jgi:hypothetical protein